MPTSTDSLPAPEPPLKKQKLLTNPITPFNTPVSKNNLIKEGDIIILALSNTEFKPFHVVPDAFYQGKKGTFHAADMIGKPFGSKVFDAVAYKKKLASKRQKIKNKFRREMNQKMKIQMAKEGAPVEQPAEQQTEQNLPEPDLPRSLCEIILLAPNSALWSRALRHRTQIIYDADIASIIFKLRLHNGSRIVEAGTGSGSLTHALIQTVMPRGHVFTFEFHEERWRAAEEEMKQHGFEPDYVTLAHGDVTTGGFIGVPDSSVDAVFLDLPAPWLCDQEVNRVLRVGGMICTFSPCIEQVQRTLAKFHQLRYEDVETVEVLRRGYFFRKHRWGDRSVQEYLESEAEIKGHTAYLSFARKGRTIVERDEVTGVIRERMS